jgi:hypothetical protein
MVDLRRPGSANGNTVFLIGRKFLKSRLGRVEPALITIIPIGDPNEATIFKSEITNKSIWP